ncbi:leucine-rich repeat domain-containing protein, partial [Microbacterium sp.]|uniref:leucine-rich repeat domain-containing protein n=1 Tax=Microbacterium sp. TaxID=51671 RepID=UPI0039E35B1C
MNIRAFARRAGAVALSVALVVGGLVFGATPAMAAPSDPVNIPDANLRACLNASLGQAADAEITEAQMASFPIAPSTTISCANKGITNLEGLQYAVNTTYVNVGQNPITDSTLPVLAQMPWLTSIYLNSTQISDLTFTQSLPALTFLHVGTTNITDASLNALANHPALQTLSIDGPANPAQGPITNLSPVATIATLETLSAPRQSISDLSPLAGHTKLNSLNLTSNKVSDITPLAQVPELRVLFLNNQNDTNRYNNITDISALAGLQYLINININFNRVSDLTPLAGLDARPTFTTSSGSTFGRAVTATNQRATGSKATINVPHANDVKSPTGNVPLTGLAADGTYSAGSNTVTYTQPHRSGTTENWSVTSWPSPALATTFNFSGVLTRQVWGQLVDIPDDALRACINGVLGQSADSDIDVLQMASLITLDCRATGVVDLTGLEYATGLVSLDLGENPLDGNLEPISGLTTLTNLELDSTGLSDLSDLSGLTNLLTLDLEDNEISDVSDLAGLTTLSGLKLARNHIQDVSDLVTLVNLASLTLEDQTLSAPTAYTGDPATIPTITDPTGAEIGYSDLGDPLASQSGATGLVTYGTPNANTVANWSHGVTIGTASATFSGQVTREVIGVAAPIVDDALRACIADALGVASDSVVTEQQIASLTSLDCRDRGIQDLTGLEFATSLTSLDLGDNPLSDLGPISDLTSLTNLELDSTGLSDLSDLSGLTNLLTLDLEDNEISDVGPLSSLTSLVGISLARNHIADVSALSTLVNVTAATLEGQTLSAPTAYTGEPATIPTLVGVDGDPVAYQSFGDPLATQDAATGLVTYGTAGANTVAPWSAQVTIGSAQVTFSGEVTREVIAIPADIADSELRACIVEALGVASDAVVTEQQIASLTSLDCRGRGIQDLTGLEFATSLRSLDLGENPLNGDLGPISGLTNLTNLELDSTGVSDLSDLADLTSLQTLDLEDNEIADVSDLAGLTALSGLKLARNHISDVSALSTLVNVRSATLEGQTLSAPTAYTGEPATIPSLVGVNGNPIAYQSFGDPLATQNSTTGDVTYGTAGANTVAPWSARVRIGSAQVTFSGEVT